MSDKGLREVAKPVGAVSRRTQREIAGCRVFAGMEGTRPVLVEVQALVAPTSLGTPRRAVVGWDSARLSMILAVLEAHCGIRLGQHDVYLNVAGGYRISERAADLAVASALVSSLAGLALRPIASISAKSACRVQSGRLRIPPNVSRKPRSSFLPGRPAICIDRAAEERQRPLERDGKPCRIWWRVSRDRGVPYSRRMTRTDGIGRALEHQQDVPLAIAVKSE